MNSSRPSRSTALLGLLLTAVLAGGSPSQPASAVSSRAETVPSVARTRPVVSRAIAPRCSPDPRPLSKSLVRYAALPASRSFTSRLAAAGGRVVDLGARRVDIKDFTPAGGTIDAGVVGPTAAGLIGAGASRSIIRVKRRSSTRARSIPRRFPHTNQLSVLRVTGPARVLQGFAVDGTDQGHLYNGLRIDAVRALQASHLKVTGIPGDDGAPPGETFGINDYRTSRSQWSHVVVDGAGVGASGFGVNGSRDIRICDVTSKDNPYGMGFAFWQTHGIRLTDSRALDNGFAGFNFERTSGSVVLVRPTALGNRYNMRIASDRSSARFTVVDPQLVDGVWTVTLPRRWYGTANRQRRSDVTLIVHGRSRPDLLRFQAY